MKSAYPWAWSTLSSASTVTVPMMTTATTASCIIDNHRLWGLWNRSLIFKTIPSYLEADERLWGTWNVAHQRASTYIGHTEVISVFPLPETPQQRAIREEAERIRWEEEQRRQRAHNKDVAAARDKAEKLLQSALSSEQREELRTRGMFHCKSKQGTLYRIYRGSHGNIRKIVGGKEVEKLCIQPNQVPEGDCMLAQKLHIENDEEGFRRTANIRHIAYPRN